MDAEEYRKRGKEMVDYIADYLENIRDRRVFPDVKPGYMHTLLPDSAPIEGEEWENIFNDIERVIMPGITHWQSPHMHAYFPALNSFPSLLGDMLADAINCLGFTWASSPACTELETIVMNWLGKMIGLPNEFLYLDSNSKGGGVIQSTASDSTLICLLAGRTRAIKKFHEKTPGFQDAEINAKLVAYCSDQAHSSVEKAALIGLVRMRYIETDENLSMRGKQLQEAIEDDIKQDLIPFWVCGTLGTTGSCAFDNIDEVGNVCRKYNLWLHIDAAYAGAAFICPELRIWLKGIEKADSLSFNGSKWLMTHFECTAMWVTDSAALHRTFNVEPLYLKHENSGLAIDYMHWQLSLSKRFRALKLWFVLRSFGIKGLQKHIREGVRLAQKFEALVLSDHRLEIPAQRHLGLVVFRIKGANELTERLLKRLNQRGNIHCVPASLKGKYIIRFTVTSTNTTTDDILKDWAEIKKVTTDILEELNVNISDRAKVSLKDTKDKNEAFGSSLLLSNTPMSPKIVNGSFAAIFDEDEFLAKTYAGIRIAHQDSPSMRRRVRGIMMSGKQFSLDSSMDLAMQSCYDSTTSNSSQKINPKNKPIREDSEDTWEAYELPRTTQVMSSGTETGIVSSTETVKLHQYVNVASDKVRVQTNSNTLIPNISTFHSLDKIVSLSSKCETNSTHHLNSPIINNNQNKNSLKVKNLDTSTIKNILTESFNITTVATTNSGRHNSDIKSSNINDSTKQHSRLTTRSWLAKESSSPIYHGKRFLEPVTIDGGICAFYNHGFNATAETCSLSKSQYPSCYYHNIYVIDKEVSEIFENNDNIRNVDWEDIKENFSRKNYDMTTNNVDKNSTEWSSLDSNKDENIPIIADDWAFLPINVDKEINECCEKCGHHTTSSSSAKYSRSSTSSS